jgi:hypothetical protein
MVVKEGTEKLRLEFNYHDFSYRNVLLCILKLHIDISLTFTFQNAD